MKQPDFTRKAIGLLLAPFALAALPAGAATLDVNEYYDYSIYDGTDEDGNRLFFYVVPDATECALIGIEGNNATVTIPDAISKVVPGTDGQETEVINVTSFRINSDYDWIINPLGGSGELTDIILPETITSIHYAPNYEKKALHFTSETVPADINLESWSGDLFSPTHRYVVYVPESVVSTYKDALLDSPCLVVAEGADPKAALEQEITDVNAIVISNDNGESGINIVTWTGKDKDGNTFGFEGYDGVTLRGIVTTASSVTVPESVCFVDADHYAFNLAPVTRFCLDYYNEENTGFPGCDNLKDIYLPSGIRYAEFHPGEVPGRFNFHFTSETAPEGYYADGTSEYYGLYARYVISAPADALEAYKEVFPEYQFLVLTEGEDPKAVMDEAIAEANAIAVTEGVEGVHEASWSGTDDKGTVFAFSSPYNNEITFRGAITDATSITIPEKVCLVKPEWYAYRILSVNSLDLYYYNEEAICFPNCNNLTDIYVPSSITYAAWSGEGFTGNYKFHFASENVPDMRLYSNAGDNVNIYVPDALFATYSEVLGDQDYILWSEAEATPVTVNVATPGTLAEKISTVIENLSDVRWLVITGTPDEVDLRMIRRLPRIEKLDLSGTTGLTSVGGCNGSKYLREVILPEGITSIDAGAFYQCRNLQTINIPDGVEILGSQAFRDTKCLKSLELPASVKTIASECFRYSGIQTVDLSNVETIAEVAFNDTRLRNVNLASAISIGNDAFSGSPLGTLTLGKDLQYLGSAAFRSCQLTDTIVIPEKVQNLEWEVFAYNPDVKKFVLNKNITRIDASFRGCQPEVVECNILFPLNENGFDSSDLSNTTLYVPALTLNEYLLHDNWVNFSDIQPMEKDLTVVDLDREYTLKSDKGIAEKAELNMYTTDHDNNKAYGHLTVDRTADLNLGNYSQSANYDYDYYDSQLGYWRYDNRYNGSTIIPESTVTADKVEVNLNLYKDRWYFLSFPFDVNVKDIVVDEDALWVVRKYDGEARANLDENTWKNMADETVLKAGEGYIFNCAVEDRDRVNFIFTPAAEGNALFANGVVAKELNEYTSEFAHNASWNLVGNTYPAYLNIKAVDFDAPITVWADNTYYAYSPVDDDYVLDPFQAFFVQRQGEGGNAVKLNPAGRAHSREAAAELDLAQPQTRAAGVNLNRSLFNFYVNGESGMDRTRIVVNSEASFAYEANRDASKFMSTSELVPQIFVNNNNVRMAINESPLGNGQFTLGTRFGKAGSYTISLDSRNATGYSVMLTDNVTGVTTDLTAGAYTFKADAVTNDNRFTVTIGIVSGVDSAVVEGLDVKVEGNALNIVADEPVEIMVVAADGKVVASEKSAEFSVTLESGIYVVKVGNVTTKVNISK